MVAIYGGQETIPGDPSHPVAYTAEEVATITQSGFGPSPTESLQIRADAEAMRAVEAERERLRIMQADAARAQQEYYGEGGTGYGTTPGGPDVAYMPSDAPWIAQTLYTGLDPYYGEGGVFAPVTDFVKGDFDKSNLLLYAALGIGALALLKR